jgi:hypothetical protein
LGALVLLVVPLSIGAEGLSLLGSLLSLLISSLRELLQELSVSSKFLLHVLRDNSTQRNVNIGMAPPVAARAAAATRVGLGALHTLALLLLNNN